MACVFVTCGGGDGGPLFPRSLLHLNVSKMEDASKCPKEGSNLVRLHAQGGHGFLLNLAASCYLIALYFYYYFYYYYYYYYYYYCCCYSCLPTHIGCSKFLCVIHIVHRDLSILHKAVALDLAGQQELIQHLLVSTSKQLVENVVAPLARLLRDDSGFLQKV